MKYLLFFVIIFCYLEIPVKANEPFSDVKVRIVGYTIFINGKFLGEYNIDGDGGISFYPDIKSNKFISLWSMWNLKSKVDTWNPDIKIAFNMADWILKKKIKKMYIDFNYILTNDAYSKTLWIYVNEKNQITLKWEIN